MPDLMEFLKNQDIGVEGTGDGLHIGVSFLEALVADAEELHWIKPTLYALPAIEAGATIGGAMVAGVALAYTGPLLGLVGTFMALGSGYAEAREEIQKEAVQSGFSQGFVAGTLRMSPTTVSSIFGRHGVVHRNPVDPEADALEAKAYNRGLIAGYLLAGTATDEEKKAFISEIREKFTGSVDAGDWDDRHKRDYVIEYAAKLRLHWLNKLVADV